MVWTADVVDFLTADAGSLNKRIIGVNSGPALADGQQVA